MAAGATSEGEGAFQLSVRLFAGQLPGSAQVSRAASLESAPWPRSRIQLPIYSRAAIQLGIAVGAAIAFGDLLSGARFYWAVIAAVVTLAGTNNTGEQVRKALFRIVGTLVGIVVGSLLVTAVGHYTDWSIVVILAALFFGLYLQRISYAFLVIGITVTVSQLYQQLGEFSNSLLLTRLAETALGAAVAIIVVNLVLPLPPGGSCGSPSGTLSARPGGWPVTPATTCWAKTMTPGPRCAPTPGPSTPPTGSDGYGSAGAPQPFRRPRRRLSRALQPASAARETTAATCLPTPNGPGCRHRARVWTSNWPARPSAGPWTRSAGAVTGPKDGAYTRSSALFDRAERRIEECSAIVGPAQLAIRDLELIDGTFAQIAEALGLPITDYDTAPAASGGMRIRGRVRGPDGAGVQAALTLITPQGWQVAQAAADAEGGYWLDAPAPGEYVLLTSAGSHLPAASGVTVRSRRTAVRPWSTCSSPRRAV